MLTQTRKADNPRRSRAAPVPILEIQDGCHFKKGGLSLLLKSVRVKRVTYLTPL
jgi:hypothetical protein